MIKLDTIFHQLATVQQEQAIIDETWNSSKSEAVLALYAIPQFALNPIK